MVQHHSNIPNDNEMLDEKAPETDDFFEPDDLYGVPVIDKNEWTGQMTAGIDSHFGIPVKTRRTEKLNPTAICLVYLKFDAARAHCWHAFYNISEAGEDFNQQLAFAEARLSEMSKGALNTIRPVREGYNFHDFSFGGRQRIFMYIDNDRDVIFDTHNAVRFTKYAAVPDQSGASRIMNKNSCFINGKFVVGKSLLRAKELFCFENWFQKFSDEVNETGCDEIDSKPGQLVHSESLEYSMNIHLLMKTYDGSAYLPIVIDPTTGNGGGANP